MCLSSLDKVLSSDLNLAVPAEALTFSTNRCAKGASFTAWPSLKESSTICFVGDALCVPVQPG